MVSCLTLKGKHRKKLAWPKICWEKKHFLVEAKASESVCENKHHSEIWAAIFQHLNSSRYSPQKCQLVSRKRCTNDKAKWSMFLYLCVSCTRVSLKGRGRQPSKHDSLEKNYRYWFCQWFLTLSRCRCITYWRKEKEQSLIKLLRGFGKYLSVSRSNTHGIISQYSQADFFFFSPPTFPTNDFSHFLSFPCWKFRNFRNFMVDTNFLISIIPSRQGGFPFACIVIN